MRKIRLSLDALTVDSFAPAGWSANVGTVRGNDSFQTFGDQVTCVSGCGATDCATCQPGGCPRDTQTCFASCGRTNGLGPCIEPNC